MRIDRRGLLIGGGVGIGLLVAWQLWPDDEAALPIPEGGRAIGGLLTLAPDGAITLHSPQVETGQGIWTGLAMLVADEMGARIDDIAVQPLPAGGGFVNPVIEDAFGTALRMTGAATSTRGFALDVRRAAATIRSLLIAEAEDRTGVTARELRIADGAVTAGPRALSFGELAGEAAGRRAPMRADLRRWGEAGVVGSRAPRVDLPAKMRGSWRFASDVRLPEMLHAAVRMPPSGGRVTGLDRARATGAPGVVELIEEEDYVAVVGETGWAAERALTAARVRFTVPPTDDARIAAAIDQAMTDDNWRSTLDIGDAVDAIEAAAAPLAARYEIAPLASRSLEASAASARMRGDGGIDIWAATQAPDATRAAVAEAIGVSAGAVRLVPMGTAGDTGQALECDIAPIAARLAQRLGRPVQAVMSHRQGVAAGPVRPPLSALAEARVSGGRIGAIRLRYAGMPGLGASLARLGGGKARMTLGQAALPYAIPDQRVDVAEADVALRTGYYRGGDPALHLFVVESLIDEAVRFANAEPLSFRIGMLASDLRMATLLRRGADLIGWDGGGAGSRMGLACGRIDGSRIACFAEAQLDGVRIRVDRLVAAVDCGAAVSPGLIEQQVTGGLIAGLADALLPAPRITQSMVFAARPEAAALANLPQVEVVVVPSDQPPGGVSSLGPAIIAPAVANALAADQGPRLRRLPLSLEDGRDG
ncbi:molybdopterin cofactor-binding domain-containing protein [Sphingomicrobium sp. XHP0239]|uniref:molybdopterin cofactor-binding domain-containing protein n=1 Tax=Sphingomicrobium maritimum TaxID=3133972 RepID=UPI0031CC5713